MIEIIVDHHSPRIEYACELIFGIILGLKWNCVPPEKETQSGLAIHYSRENPKHKHHIPCTGWLYEDKLKPVQPSLEVKNVALLFPYHRSHARLKFDLLAATFYLATEYHRYFQYQTDPHGRPDPKHSFLYDNGLHQQPLIHWYAQQLKDWLLELDPDLKFPSRKFDYEIAIDVDQPWRFMHRSLPIQAGGLLRDLLHGKFSEVRARLKASSSQKDPYDFDSELFEMLPPEKTLFFFLIKRRSHQDNRFSLPHPQYEKLIREIQNKGYRIGIHPSYLSSDQKGAIAEEITMLKKVVGPVYHSRQHFLRYRLPETFLDLEISGIQHEYSLNPVHEPGFCSGMAQPFPWFNVKRNTTTELLLHPGMVMDRSLQQYQGLSPEKAEKIILRIAQTVKRVNGKFVLNLHNETFSNTAEWKGWRQMLGRVIVKLEEWAQDENKLSAKP